MVSKGKRARVLVCMLLPACGQVAKSDPSFWEPTEDVGGVHRDLGAPGNVGGAAGAAGQPVFGAGGQETGPGGNGGASAGGANPFGGSPPAAGGAEFGAGGGFTTESGGADNAGGAPPVGPGSTCDFTFSVTTSTANGRFAPRNVGAVWIQTAAGTFEKTLETWGSQRLPNATAWTAVSGSNTVDAVTGATLPSHRAHTSHWNCTDKSRAVVPTGGYKVCATFAEDDAFPFFGPPTHMACADFNLGGGPVDAQPPAQPNFSAMHVVIQ